MYRLSGLNIWLRLNWLKILLVFVLVVNIFIMAKPAFSPWNPLTDYPTQTVVADHEVVTLHSPTGDYTTEDPVIYWSGRGPIIVVVKGKKCNTSSVEFDVDGTRFFDIYSPVVEHIPPSGSVRAVRQPGCTDLTFRNTLSDEITSIISSNLSATSPVEMSMGGVETPIDENGKNSISRTWETEKFTIKLR